MRGEKTLLRLIILLLVFSSGVSQAQELPAVRRSFLPGVTENSYAAWPVLAWTDGHEDEALDRVNHSVYEDSRMTVYLAVLMQPGGNAGFQADYETDLSETLYAVRMTVQGKMPKGRPAQRHTPFMFRWQTGERIGVSDVFTDPDAARGKLESYILVELTESLSDYLESAALVPLPMERFLIVHDTILFDYEPEDYTLLSGGAGSLSFTLEELARLTGDTEKLAFFQTMPFEPDDKTAERIRGDVKNGRFPSLYLSVSRPADTGIPLTETEPAYGAPNSYQTVYPDGYAVSTENPFLRDIQVLTDPTGEKVNGYLAKRGNLHGLVIGQAKKEDVRRALGQPGLSAAVSAETAEVWLICPGSIDIYQLPGPADGTVTLSFGYSDENILTSVTLRDTEQEEITSR